MTSPSDTAAHPDAAVAGSVDRAVAASRFPAAEHDAQDGGDGPIRTGTVSNSSSDLADALVRAVGVNSRSLVVGPVAQELLSALRSRVAAMQVRDAGPEHDQRIAVPVATFDVVLLGEALAEVEHPQQLIDLLVAHQLSDDGRVVLLARNASHAGRTLALLSVASAWPRTDGQERHFTFERLVALLQNCHLSPVSIDRTRRAIDELPTDPAAAGQRLSSDVIDSVIRLPESDTEWFVISAERSAAGADEDVVNDFLTAERTAAALRADGLADARGHPRGPSDDLDPPSATLAGLQLELGLAREQLMACTGEEQRAHDLEDQLNHLMHYQSAIGAALGGTAEESLADRISTTLSGVRSELGEAVEGSAALRSSVQEQARLMETVLARLQALEERHDTVLGRARRRLSEG